MSEKYNPAKDPVWDEISSILKISLRLAKGNFGLALFEQNGSVACTMLGDETMGDNRRTVASLRLFRDRLDDLIRHAEDEELDFNNGNQRFIRDAETGEYKIVD